MSVQANLYFSLKLFWGFFTGQSGGKQIRGAVIGLAVAFVPLILVLIVTGGMIQGITNRYLETSSYHFQVFPSHLDGPEHRDTLENLPGVSAVFTERSGFALAYSDETTRTGVQIRGVSKNLWEDPGFLEYLEATQGYAEITREDGILLGRNIADKLNIQAGQEIKILTARTIRGRIIPRVSTYHVEGIVTVGYRELDGLWAFLPLDQAEKIISGDEYSNIYGVKVENPYQNLEQLIDLALAELPLGFRAFSWMRLNQAQYNNFEATRFILLLIMTLVVIVSAFNLSSSLVMVVMERQKELAILKSIGAKTSDIVLIFLFCGFLTGVLGTSLGFLVGLAVGVNINLVVQGLDGFLTLLGWIWNLIRGLPLGSGVEILNSEYYLESIPVVLDPWTLVLLAQVSITMATVFSAWPAARAAGLKPLSILRKVG